jgi:hypothetical protein
MFASNQFVYSNAGILRLSELVPANITFGSSFDIPIENNIKIQSLTSATPLCRLRSGETTQIRSIRIQEGRGLRRVRVAVDAALAETYWNNWFASDVFQEGLVARRCVVVRGVLVKQSDLVHRACWCLRRLLFRCILLSALGGHLMALDGALIAGWPTTGSEVQD